MSVDQVSVIEIRNMNREEGSSDNNEVRETNAGQKEMINFLVFSIFGIIGICCLFIIPWIIIPRTNSIFYQSAWLEVTIPMTTNFVLLTANEVLNLAVFTQERSLMSVKVFSRIFLMYLISGNGLYILAFVIWTQYLGFYHPVPHVAVITSFSQWVIFGIGLWYLLPSEYMKRHDFRRKLQLYTIYYIWTIIVGLELEGVIFVFVNLSTQYQFLASFVLVAVRELDRHIRAILVKKMIGEKNESASALLAITIGGTYAFFTAIRLVGAELDTVCSFLVLDALHHLSLTYEIIKEHKKVDNEIFAYDNKKNPIIAAKLAFAELIEGITPIVYGICIAIAYYGPNSRILGNIGCSYWSYQEIEDISILFGTMLLLFSFDTLSVLINFLCLQRTVNMNMVQNFYQVLQKYWFYMAIKLGYYMSTLFVSLDINFGSDGTGEFNWITHQGWLELVNNSTDLTNDEKAKLLNNQTKMIQI